MRKTILNARPIQRAIVLGVLLCIGGNLWAQDKPDAQLEKNSAPPSERKGFSAGFDISDSANARQIGLPIYPGAKASRDSENESAAANLSVWAGAFGAKLIVMKLETGDTTEKVSRFYQDALMKYGTVLDCSKGSAASEEPKKSSVDDTLRCEKGSSAKNGKLYKAGSKRMQHIVGIEPYGDGTRFQLVYIEARGVD